MTAIFLRSTGFEDGPLLAVVPGSPEIEAGHSLLRMPGGLFRSIALGSVHFFSQVMPRIV